MGYDALVVGAGAGGCHAARRLAEAGLQVALLEREAADTLGYAWSDSIERAAFARADVALPSGEEFAGPVERLDLYTPDQTLVASLAPYDYVLTNRRPFTRRLYDDARRAGVDALDETPVTGALLDDGRVVGVRTSRGELRAPLVIDASGNARAVTKDLPAAWGLAPPRPSLVSCYRETRDAPGPGPGRLAVVMGVDGYAWAVTDRHGEVDIGAGVVAGRGVSPRDAFAALVSRRQELDGPVATHGGGVIPLGRPPASLVHHGVMVLGDAACQALPTSGTGVGSALVAAQQAAEAAISAHRAGRADRATLWGYNTAYFRERGSALVALDAMRRALQELSEAEVAFLVKRGVVAAELLRAGAHGRWEPPSPSELARAFGQGWPRVDLLVRLGLRLRHAEALARHYRAFPERPGPEEVVWAAWRGLLAAQGGG